VLTTGTTGNHDGLGHDVLAKRPKLLRLLRVKSAFAMVMKIQNNQELAPDLVILTLVQQRLKVQTTA
jgi:hypothetical protein